MWSLPSLWNAAHDGLPVTIIVVSNSCYRQVRMMTAKILEREDKGRTLGTSLCPPGIDFCQIAGGMGIAGQRVTEPQELGPALRRAFESGQPRLVEVVVDPSF
jgi:benzoylformate decarboxylase